MTVNDWLVQAQEQLKSANIPSARLDSELLLGLVLQQGRTWLLAHGDHILTKENLSEANKLLTKRQSHFPIAYLRGWQEFYGRRFHVTTDTLIPRPETETIIEYFASQPRQGRLLDVGTGSGCIGITLALEHPTLQVDLCDVSSTALAVARHNCTLLQAPIEPAAIFPSDLLSATTYQYDYIVANLPYVDRRWQRSRSTDFEPVLALFAAEEGLALIKELILQANPQQPPAGQLILEADPIQHPAIIQFGAKHGYRCVVQEEYMLVFERS